LHAYAPRTHVYRTRTAIRYTTASRHHRRVHVARTHVRDVRFAHRAGLTAQASVPVHHTRHHRGDIGRHTCAPPAAIETRRNKNLEPRL
jgi:hypothetical protein